MGDFVFPFSNGYEAAFYFGCDTSPGHSGGSVYDVGTGYVLGINIAERCATCTGSADYWGNEFEDYPEYKSEPNIAKRLDQYIVDLIDTKRVEYP